MQVSILDFLLLCSILVAHLRSCPLMQDSTSDFLFSLHWVHPCIASLTTSTKQFILINLLLKTKPHFAAPLPFHTPKSKTSTSGFLHTKIKTNFSLTQNKALLFFSPHPQIKVGSVLHPLKKKPHLPTSHPSKNTLLPFYLPTSHKQSLHSFVTHHHPNKEPLFCFLSRLCSTTQTPVQLSHITVPSCSGLHKEAAAQHGRGWKSSVWVGALKRCKRFTD